MRNRLLAGGLLLVLGVANGLIARNEAAIAGGRTVFLRLGNYDPRSLLQGDYMRLRFELADEAAVFRDELPERGRLVLLLDDRNRGKLHAYHVPGSPIQSHELSVSYRLVDGRVDIGTDAWFFQEDQADLFRRAAYGEFRVSRSGHAVLVGLVDADLRPLGLERPRWWSGAGL